jgi:hypothetical protein
MTFPTTPISTDNLNSSADDPSLARADLLQAVETINTILDTANQGYGVVVLQSDGTIDPTVLPGTLAPTGQLTLYPSNGFVKVQNILRLQQIPVSTLTILTDVEAGDVALATDADSGNPALCIYDGTDWKYLPMASWTTVTV